MSEFALDQFSIPSGSSTTINRTKASHWFGNAWTDGGSRAPQAALIIARSGTNGSSRANTIHWSNGISDGTNVYCNAGYSQDGNTSTTTTASRQITTGVILEIAGAGEEIGLATISFSNDQYTITIPNPFSVDMDVKVVLFSSAVVHLSQVSNSTGNFSKTGLGNLAAQDCAGIFLMGRSSVLDAGGSQDMFSLGFASASAGMGGVFRRALHAVSSNIIFGSITSSAVMARLTTGTGAFSDSTAFVSWDSDGYTLNHLINDGSQYRYGVLIVKGSLSLGTSINARTDTNNITKSCTGITPKFVLGLADGITTASTTNGVEGNRTLVGAMTPQGQWGHFLQTFNAEPLGGGSPTDEFSRGVTDAFIINYGRSAADTLSAEGIITFNAFDPDLITLNQSDADTATIFIPILVLGDSSGSADFSQSVNGSETPVGVITTFDIGMNSLVGNLAGAGSLSRRTSKTPVGSVALSGTVSPVKIPGSAKTYEKLQQLNLSGSLVTNLIGTLGYPGGLITKAYPYLIRRLPLK